MNFSAVILAGGQSRRMGRDKAWLPVNGQPLIARQIETVRQLAPVEIFISGRTDTNYTSLGCPVLHDDGADLGPMAGIARALDATSTPLLLVLAVDLPNLSATLLRQLADARREGRGVISRVGGAIEPLAGFYPKAALALAKTHLLDSRRAVKVFAENCALDGLADYYDLPAAEADAFANLNAPGDLLGIH